jgi:shikimate 5-dehydrogenase
MNMGRGKGAAVSNGYKMLTLQAEKSWEIWTSGLETIAMY